MTGRMLAFAVVLLLGSWVCAQQKGGFTGPGLKVITVKEAKKL